MDSQPVRPTSPRPQVAGLVGGRLGVLFENSIVCLVVFVCCLFLPHLAVPVVGCGFFVTFGDFVRFL